MTVPEHPVRNPPRLMGLVGHNHTSIAAHFNTADDALGRELLDFIRIGK